MYIRITQRYIQLKKIIEAENLRLQTSMFEFYMDMPLNTGYFVYATVILCDDNVNLNLSHPTLSHEPLFYFW